MSFDPLSVVNVSSEKCPFGILSGYRPMEEPSQNSINLFLHSINPSYLKIIIKVPFLPLFTYFPILFKAIPFFFKFSKSTEFRILDRNATEDCIEGPGNLEGLFKLTISLCILPPSNYSNLITNSFWRKEKYLTWLELENEEVMKALTYKN